MKTTKTPEELREKAKCYRQKADEMSRISSYAGDHAPGSYVTGASGRSRTINKRSERALEKTIQYAKRAVAYRRKAEMFEVQASWIENAPKRAQAKQKLLAGEKREKKSRRSMPPQERLFIGCYPTGIVYADCAHEVGGDYKTLGYLNYRTLVLDLKPGCPAELAELIQADATKMQAMRGQFFPISTCGQGVTLGE